MPTYGVGLVIGAILGYWAYTDAKKRKGVNPVLWGVVCFLFGLLGLLVYWLVVMRKSDSTEA